MAELLNRDYANRDLNILCILKGAAVFAVDLIRHLTVPVRLHFIQTSSYGTGTESSGTVHIQYTSPFEVEGQDVLIVEDILDTGITLDYLIRQLEQKNPRSLRVCVLLNKPERRHVQLEPEYTGFEIPNQFVFGYGLDYQELGRNLRYIAILDPSEYRK